MSRNFYLENIERIFYFWVRYEGKRVKDSKSFSKSEVKELIKRLQDYLENPDKFDYNKVAVVP